MSIPIGLQLYSVREDCKRDLPGTLAAVAKMGYDGVEFAGYHDRPADELRRMLDDLGLACCGTHIGMATLLGDELEPTIEFNRMLGNRYLILPSMPKDRRDPKKALWLDNARVVNEIAERVRPHDMLVGYHSHSIDFKQADGQTLWDIFAANTRDDVVLQIDTGNAMSAGADPMDTFRQFPGRQVTVHLKGIVMDPRASDGFDWTFAGEGDVPWADVFAACRTTGRTEWYIVEHENYPIPPLACVERCVKNLRAMV